MSSESFVVLLLTHILGFQDVIVFRDLFFTLNKELHVLIFVS